MGRSAFAPAAPEAPDVNPGDLVRLVEAIYRGVEDRQGMRDFLERAAEVFGAFSASIYVVDHNGLAPRYIACHPPFSAAASTYIEQFPDTDPILEAILRAEPRQVYVLGELVDAETRSTHPYFVDWAERHDVGDVLTCRLPFGNGFGFMVGLLRRRSAPSFSGSERTLMGLLLPHFEQANALHARLDRYSVFAALAQEQLAQAGHGLAVLDQYGRLLFANPAGKRLLRESGVLRPGEVMLASAEPAQCARFEDLWRRCLAASVREAAPVAGALRFPGNQGFHVLVSMLPYRVSNANSFFPDYAARVLLVLSHDVPESSVTEGQLERMFGLTAVEAGMLSRIGKGESLEDIAAGTGQSLETLRTRLKRVFGKTGVRRQSELVRLVMQGVPGWINPAELFP
jgi:DNA-binding CsgD family transcriptional regulator